MHAEDHVRDAVLAGFVQRLPHLGHMDHRSCTISSADRWQNDLKSSDRSVDHQLQATCFVPNLDESIQDDSHYPSHMTESRSAWPERRQLGAAIIALLLLSLAGLNTFIPASNISAHNVLHHLNFLPLMIAGMLFGWRGAMAASVLAGAVNLPAIARHWVEWPLDAKDQVVELIIFSFAGLIAGYLSDRERAHRQSLERTRQELESVYLGAARKHCRDEES